MKSIINFCLRLGVAAGLLGACGGEGGTTATAQPERPREGGAFERAAGEGGEGAPDAALAVELGTECGTTLPGPPLATGVAEGQMGTAELLAGIDTSRVPDPLVYRTASPLVRALVDYALERDRAVGSAGERGELSRADAIDAGAMGHGVLAAAAKGGAGTADGGIDVTLLRRVLHHNYRCVRRLPTTLEGIRSLYGDYSAWPTREVRCSRPKNGPRRLHENHELGVYVAETLEGEAIRETEILFTKTRVDGQIDFAVYTPEGALTDRSTFATQSGSSVTSAAPYTCMACHAERGSLRFTVLSPDGTGAGCKTSSN